MIRLIEPAKGEASKTGVVVSDVIVGARRSESDGRVV